MRYENYKSDIKLEVTLKLGGVAIAVPSHDFEVRFTSGDNGKAYVCSYLGGVWNKCAPIENGNKLECYLDNHGLGPGRLKALFVDHAPDGSMPDGDKVTAVPSKLDIELITGAGDDATSVEAEVVVDIYSAIADARAIADELESKLASGYFKGDPGEDGQDGADGADGADGQDGVDGVGITSIAKTGTSGLVDTYTITLTNGNSTTFTVTNGADGQDGQDGADGVGIASITEQTSSASGGVNVVTVILTDGTILSFTVRNGIDGQTPDMSQYALKSDLAAKADATTLVEVQTTGDVTQALESGKFYKFGELDSLTITLTAASAGMAQYGGKFTASANWSALGLPATVDEAAGNDTVAAGKTYEFNVLDNVIVLKEV